MRADVAASRTAPAAVGDDASPLRLAAGGALGIFVWSRVAIWALAAGVVLVFDGHLNPARGRWDGARLHELGSAVDVWARWDSTWYLQIAESGYDWPSSTPAFFPLYPTIVAGAGRALGGHYLLAGLLVSLTASAAAFVLVHDLVRARLGPAAARRAVLYLAVFPTSLFLGAVYGEGLFLALAAATFGLAERERLGWAAVAAGLALLTRPQGVALLPVLALFAWRSRSRGRAVVLVAAPVGMFLAYPLALELWVGHGLAFLDAQRIWDRSLAPLGPLGGLVQAVGEGDVLGPTLAVSFLALAVVAWRGMGAPYGVYAVAVLALPMAFPSERLGGLYSFPRFAVVAFPCLAALGLLGRDRRVHGAVTAVLGAWLAVNVVRWALWYWVA